MVIKLKQLMDAVTLQQWPEQDQIYHDKKKTLPTR